MMEIINTKSPRVLALTRHRGKGKEDTFTVKEREVYFNKSFCITYGLKEGMFVHFINDGNNWKFFFNNDSDGFKVVKLKSRSTGLMIFSAGLAHLFRKTTGYLGTRNYLIQKTMLEQQKNVVYSIVPIKEKP